MRLLLRWQPEPGLDAVEPEGRSKSGTGIHAFNLTRRAIGLLQSLGRCVARGSRQERFLDRCSFSQARRWRSMRRRWLGVRSDSTPRQNGASARVPQRPAAAEMIRASVTNRVDNGVPGAAVANHGRRRSERSRAVLRTVACRGANSRSASAHRRPIDQGRGGPSGGPAGQRRVRGVTAQ